MKYILSIDGGSQSTKATIFDLEGRIIASASKPLKPYDLPGPGLVEHPGDDLWDSLVAACKKLMDRFEGNPADIAAMGLCSIRFDRVLMKEDGTLAQPALSWMDIRVSRPYVHDNPAVSHVASTNGYLTARLTGQFKDSAASYQGMWPIDTDAWQWFEDSETFDYYNIPREMLCELKMPGEVVGHLTVGAAALLGLPEGLPVVATGNDKAVEALGTGALSEGSGLISLGTYVCGMVHGDRNPKNTVNYWVNFASMPHRYIYESTGIRKGMGHISWFRDLLGEEASNKAKERGISPEDYLAELAEKIPAGSEGLMVVPEWLAPADRQFKKGMFIGFDNRHGAGHMYRAIMESLAMTMKIQMDALCEELGIRLEQITVSGGGSNSGLFMQIFADVFGIPASRNEVNGAAAVGAAICAAVAEGIYPTFEEAAAKMVRQRDVFTPSAENHEKYVKIINGIYKDLTSYTDPMLEKAYEVFSNL